MPYGIPNSSAHGHMHSLFPISDSLAYTHKFKKNKKKKIGFKELYKQTKNDFDILI